MFETKLHDKWLGFFTFVSDQVWRAFQRNRLSVLCFIKKNMSSETSGSTWAMDQSHRCTHGLKTYVRRPWLIVLGNLGYSMFMPDCPSAWSALWRTRMLLPNAGRKIADWLLRGFIQCANIQILIARSITASVHKFGGCGYDDGPAHATPGPMHSEDRWKESLSENVHFYCVLSRFLAR